MLFSRILFGFCLATIMLGAALADTPSVPTGKPLSEGEIKALLAGRIFEFAAYDEPLTGTTEWNFEEGIVSGSYVWDKSDEGTFKVELYIENDRLCTKGKNKDPVCQIVYKYEEGFMEVTAKGVVHAVSKPVK